VFAQVFKEKLAAAQSPDNKADLVELVALMLQYVASGLLGLKALHGEVSGLPQAAT
jgi:hypothetical protein